VSDRPGFLEHFFLRLVFQPVEQQIENLLPVVGALHAIGELRRRRPLGVAHRVEQALPHVLVRRKMKT